MGKQKKIRDMIHRHLHMKRSVSEKVMVRHFEEKREPAPKPIPEEHSQPPIATPSYPAVFQEIDFSMDKNLERYVTGLHIHYTTIEKWISAGLLLPKELIVAQKMIRLLRKNGP